MIAFSGRSLKKGQTTPFIYKKKAYDGFFNLAGLISKDITAYVGPNAPVDDHDFRKKLLLAYTLVDHFGVAWTQQFANLYVSMPENVNIVYWPGVRWADNTSSKLNVVSEEWVYITTPKIIPSEKASGLAFIMARPHSNGWCHWKHPSTLHPPTP